jgi:hypothetical protein
VHDPDAVLVEQRVELAPERGEAAGLDLDELAVGADEVDDVPADRHLEAVSGLGQPRLDRGVERSLAQHADGRHAQQASGAGGR